MGSKCFLILGDSHCNATIKALRRNYTDCSFFGGQLQLGAGWQKEFHSNSDNLSFLVPEAQEKFEIAHLEATGRRETNLLAVDIPIIFSLSSIESCVHLGLWKKWSPADATDRIFVSRAVVEEIIDAHFSHIFDFFRFVGSYNLQVVNNISPLPRDNTSYLADVHDVLREILRDRYADLGVALVDVSDQTRDEGTRGLKPEFWSGLENDKIHGNDKWGDCVAAALMAHLKN